MKAVHLHIYGRVQGVGFRRWTVRTARAQSLRGWVRNRADGHVEIVAAGEAAHVNAFVQACRRGPATAQVTRVDVEDSQPTVDTADFESRPTL